jgi:hypothetical protein
MRQAGAQRMQLPRPGILGAGNDALNTDAGGRPRAHRVVALSCRWNRVAAVVFTAADVGAGVRSCDHFATATGGSVTIVLTSP